MIFFLLISTTRRRNKDKFTCFDYDLWLIENIMKRFELKDIFNVHHYGGIL